MADANITRPGNKAPVSEPAAPEAAAANAAAPEKTIQFDNERRVVGKYEVKHGNEVIVIENL